MNRIQVSRFGILSVCFLGCLLLHCNGARTDNSQQESQSEPLKDIVFHYMPGISSTDFTDDVRITNFTKVLITRTTKDGTVTKCETSLKTMSGGSKNAWTADDLKAMMTGNFVKPILEGEKETFTLPHHEHPEFIREPVLLTWEGKSKTFLPPLTKDEEAVDAGPVAKAMVELLIEIYHQQLGHEGCTALQSR